MIEHLIEGLKELGRIALLGAVSYLLTADVLVSVIAAFGFHLSPETQIVIIGLLTSVLKSVDEWLHEAGKATNNKDLIGGLTRF